MNSRCSNWTCTVSDGFGEIIKVFGLDLDYRFRGKPAAAVTTLMGDRHGHPVSYWPGWTQFSTSSAGTPTNSDMLFVTSTKPSLRA